jgi:hypothetical protein
MPGCRQRRSVASSASDTKLIFACNSSSSATLFRCPHSSTADFDHDINTVETRFVSISAGLVLQYTSSWQTQRFAAGGIARGRLQQRPNFGPKLELQVVLYYTRRPCAFWILTAPLAVRALEKDRGLMSGTALASVFATPAAQLTRSPHFESRSLLRFHRSDADLLVRQTAPMR